MLVIGMIIGFVLGSWLSFNFVLDVGIDKIHQVMYNISTDL
jgi:ABC-type nitrate/sulfonate/bicarbonate transport system permease component